MTGNDGRQDRDPLRNNRADDADAGARRSDRGGSGGSEGDRDFGDSAGYGSGGSTLDRRDVVGEESTGPNPLDEVMDPDRSD